MPKLPEQDEIKAAQAALAPYICMGKNAGF
jgi:hypothetical protein